MNVVFGLENIKNAMPAATTVGTFDGVHLGHVKIINSLKFFSEKDNLKSTLITFDPHPRVVLQQVAPFKTKLLTKLDERLELLQNQGLDQVIIAKFSRQFSELDYKEFIKHILLEKVNTKVLVVGYDHGFGKDRSGNFDEIWSDIPIKLSKISFTLSQSTLPTSFDSVTFPVTSYVLVCFPNSISARYTLSASLQFNSFFVSSPVPKISNPSANGSNVPAWPTFLNLPIFLIFLTTSNELQSAGLSIRITLCGKVSVIAKMESLLIILVMNFRH